MLSGYIVGNDPFLTNQFIYTFAQAQAYKNSENYLAACDYYDSAINQLSFIIQSNPHSKSNLFQLYSLYLSRSDCYLQLKDSIRYVSDILFALNILLVRFPIEEWSDDFGASAEIAISQIQIMGEMVQNTKFIALAEFQRNALHKRREEFLVFRQTLALLPQENHADVLVNSNVEFLVFHLQKLALLPIEKHTEDSLNSSAEYIQELDNLGKMDLANEFKERFEAIKNNYWRLHIDYHYKIIDGFQPLAQTEHSSRMLYSSFIALSNIFHVQLKGKADTDALKMDLYALDALHQIVGFIEDDIYSYCFILQNLSIVNPNFVFSKLCLFALNVCQGKPDTTQDKFKELQNLFIELQDFDSIRRAIAILKYLKERMSDGHVHGSAFQNSLYNANVLDTSCIVLTIRMLEQQMQNFILTERLAKSELETASLRHNVRLNSSVSSNDLTASRSSASLPTSPPPFFQGSSFDTVKSNSTPVLGNAILKPKGSSRHSAKELMLFPPAQPFSKAALELVKKAKEETKKGWTRYLPFKKH